MSPVVEFQRHYVWHHLEHVFQSHMKAIGTYMYCHNCYPYETEVTLFMPLLCI